MLISDNSLVSKTILILTLYRMRMQGYCDVYKWTILKRTSPEVKCLHLTSSRRVSNMIYHIFSHGTAFYKLNGKSVNVMLEFSIKICNRDNLGIIIHISPFKHVTGIIKGNYPYFSIKTYVVTPH